MVGYILESNMIVSRCLTAHDNEYAKVVMKRTHDYYQLNKSKYHRDMVSQSVDVMVKNYGEIQSKFPETADIYKVLKEYIKYYVKELNEYKKYYL